MATITMLTMMTTMRRVSATSRIRKRRHVQLLAYRLKQNKTIRCALPARTGHPPRMTGSTLVRSFGGADSPPTGFNSDPFFNQTPALLPGSSSSSSSGGSDGVEKKSVAHKVARRNAVFYWEKWYQLSSQYTHTKQGNQSGRSRDIHPLTQALAVY